MRTIILLSLLVIITPTLAGRFRPSVPLSWDADVRFVLDKELSDEFRGSELDMTKWDPHGVRNPNTGCPKWNGPPSRDFPDYSTFFPTTTDPATGQPTVKQYRMSRGRLLLKIDEKPLEFFTSREYYCNATTFKCNHDESINCFATDFFGNPRFADRAKTIFRGLVHDKCKKEPYCIPHPEHVTKQPRIYKRLVGAHLTSKKSFKYGYVEVMAKLGRSPAVAGAWMHDDNLVNGYCRYKRDLRPGRTAPLLECPSAIRSRRWQEIDVLESMNSQIHKRRYIPNIHAFSGYKGEFTSASAMDNGDGNAGGGPIMLEQHVFTLKRPNFSDVPENLRRGNDWHYNPGSVTELDADWARKKRRVGMYWSPKEIRFLIDGKEVRRVKNTLIHQPMNLDLSYALNVAWAQEFPTDKHLRQEVKFFHYRRYEVLTAGGVDPPSTLPLDDEMEREFLNLYGNELGGVFGRFPANDNQTIEQTIPDMPDVMEATPEAEIGTVRMETGWRGDYFASRSSARMNRGRGAANQVKQLLKQGFLPAGGEGNMRFTSETPEMTKRERVVAESRADRMATVEDGEAETIEDAAITVYEFTNPNMDAAGWSTPGGLGKVGLP